MILAMILIMQYKMCQKILLQFGYFCLITFVCINVLGSVRNPIFYFLFSLLFRDREVVDWDVFVCFKQTNINIAQGVQNWVALYSGARWSSSKRCEKKRKKLKQLWRLKLCVQSPVDQRIGALVLFARDSFKHNLFEILFQIPYGDK